MTEDQSPFEKEETSKLLHLYQKQFGQNVDLKSYRDSDARNLLIDSLECGLPLQHAAETFEELSRLNKRLFGLLGSHLDF